MGTNSFLTFLLTLVVFMTISCASQIQIPVDCKELLLIEGLQAKLSIPIEVEKLHHWIAQTYNLSLRDIEMADEYKGLSTLKWQTRGATYTLTVRDSMPYDVRIGFGTNGPPFGELLGCLGWGDPDYYWAFFGDTMPYGKMYTVDLYFLDEGGFVASGKGLYRAIAPPPLNTELPVNVMVLVKPGPLEEIYSQIHHGVSLESRAPSYRPKPWPGSWADLEYVEELWRNR